MWQNEKLMVVRNVRGRFVCLFVCFCLWTDVLNNASYRYIYVAAHLRKKSVCCCNDVNTNRT